MTLRIKDLNKIIEELSGYRCSCGIECSELFDGKCYDCWLKQHQPKPIKQAEKKRKIELNEQNPDWVEKAYG